MWSGVQFLWIHAFPPEPLAIRLGQVSIIGNTGQRAFFVRAKRYRKELPPGAAGSTMDGDTEAKPLSAGRLFPLAHDIFLRPDIDGIPVMVPGIPGVKIAVMVTQGREVSCPGAFVARHERCRIPVLGLPKIADVLV